MIYTFEYWIFNDAGISQSDEDGGSCLLYNNADLAINFLLLLGSVKGLSAIATIVAAVVYRAPHLADDFDHTVIVECQDSSTGGSTACTYEKDKVEKSAGANWACEEVIEDSCHHF